MKNPKSNVARPLIRLALRKLARVETGAVAVRLPAGSIQFCLRAPLTIDPTNALRPYCVNAGAVGSVRFSVDRVASVNGIEIELF